MDGGVAAVVGIVLLFAVLFMGPMRSGYYQTSAIYGPPPIVASEPGEMVMIPQTDAYYVPDFSFDIFFSQGYWWSPRGGSWYRAGSYSGPWQSVGRENVPNSVTAIPKDYRNVYKGGQHVSYGEWKGRQQNNNSDQQKRERGR